MRPQIIALGRSDNHPLLSSHARAIGVGYLGIEAFEASDLMRDSKALNRWLDSISTEGQVALAAIDSSVPSATLKSFAALLNSELSKRGQTNLLLRTDPALLHHRNHLEGTRVEVEVEVEKDALQLLSIARSPHGQIAIWPILTLNREGAIQFPPEMGVDDQDKNEEGISLLMDQIIKEVQELSLVGVVNYIIDSGIEPAVEPAVDYGGTSIIGREFGASTYTFWSESASYTSITEQLVRAILDLPLGDTRIIDFDQSFLEQEITLEDGMINDSTRPLLHLYARNPRLKVRYLTDASDRDFSSVRLSLYANTEAEAHHEMNHAIEFMLGRVDEHAP